MFSNFQFSLQWDNPLPAIIFWALVFGLVLFLRHLYLTRPISQSEYDTKMYELNQRAIRAINTQNQEEQQNLLQEEKKLNKRKIRN